jgi:hypothetical protein
MAQIKALKGTKLLVKIEDPAAPGAFVHPLLMNLSRNLSFDANMVEDELQDGDDPDAPADVYSFKSSVKFTADGQGKLDTASLDFWLTFFESKDSYNVHLVFDATGANGGQTVTAKVHCSKFTPTGEPHKNAEAQVSLVSDGPWTRAANA